MTRLFSNRPSSTLSAESDLVVINAGSSAGREDFTADVIAELGEVLVHGVAIKPGKPVILAIVQGKPVIGIPGYPVSAALTFNLFVKPLIYALLGLASPAPERSAAKFSRQVASSLGAEEFIRVKLGSVSGKLIATPVTRGAGALMSLVRADGIIRVPAESEGIARRARCDGGAFAVAPRYQEHHRLHRLP